MTKTQGLRLAVFMALLGIILNTVIGVFGLPADGGTISIKRRFGEFYNEPEDTWDCVLVGTSCVDREWVAPMAWNDYGMAVYAMNTAVQPIVFTTNLLDEVRKKQDVKVAVVDIRGIRMETLKPDEAKFRRVTDSMEPSINRWKTVKKALQYSKEYYMRDDVEDEPKELDEAAMYFSFLKYHTRWKSGLYDIDFLGTSSELKGVYEERAFDTKKVKPTEVTRDVQELNDLQKSILDEIIEFGEDEGGEFLFISSPSQLSQNEQIEINTAIQYLEEKGANAINFNTQEKYNEIGIDFSEDLYDKHHLNSRGAVKFTKYFSKYLYDNYQFEDKRGREEYQEWDEAYRKYVEFYEDGWNRADK